MREVIGALSRSAITVALLLLSGPARANDGGITMGGSPKLLSGHPTVQMKSEVVRINVGKKKLNVDARFTFVNHGPACTVRMGFPDRGIGSANPDNESSDDDRDEVDIMKQPPRTSFTSFRSWVNGKAVATKLIRANTWGKYWHTKTVRFPAHSIVHIRDAYEESVSVGVFRAGEWGGYKNHIGYLLNTGSSWRGSIERTDIIIRFNRARVPSGRIKPIPGRFTYLDEKGSQSFTTACLKPGTVVWKGPSTPTVLGRRMTFTRTTYRPTVNDDLELSFSFDKMVGKISE